MAGPSVKFTSISTESMEKARRRSSSSVKRWRHSVRVSTVMGIAKKPASAAQASTAGSPAP